VKRALFLAALLGACGRAELPAPFDAGAAEAKLPTVAQALRDGDGATALAELDRAASAGPLPDGALLLRALALELSGREADAQGVLAQELDAHPGDGRARALLARHLIEAGQLDEAGRELDMARQLAPRDVTARLLSGRLALARQDDEAALRAFQDVLADDPWGSAAVEAHSGMSQILQRRGPLEAQGAQAHAQAAAELKQMRETLADARARLRKDPRDAEACFQMATAFLALYRDFADNRLRDEAEAALQQMLALKPDDARALFNLGFLRATQRRFDEALDFSRRAVDADPHLMPARLNLALVLTQMGRQAEAVPHMEVVANEAADLKDRVHAHVDIAHLLGDSADPAQRALAASHARAALDLMPTDPFGVRKLLERLEAPSAPAAQPASKPGPP
jgi:tetratricopeptide (TPR) repeat protein